MQIDPERLRKVVVRTSMFAPAAVMPRLKCLICIDVDVYDLT